MKNLLPIGSVVLLKGGSRRLMITGRMQVDTATNKSYDYSACFYPEGIINSDSLILFDNDAIQAIFFLGFQDFEEFQFKKFVDELPLDQIRDEKAEETTPTEAASEAETKENP